MNLATTGNIKTSTHIIVYNVDTYDSIYGIKTVSN